MNIIQYKYTDQIQCLTYFLINGDSDFIDGLVVSVSESDLELNTEVCEVLFFKL